MAIVKWGLAARQPESGSVDKDNVRTYTRTYLALTDTVMGPLEIRLDSRVPKPFTRHPEDPGAYVVDVSPSRVSGSRYHWTVTVTYSSDAGERKDPNPIARPAKITGEFNEYTRPIFKDRKGNPIVTTAGEPIPMDVEESDLILNIEKAIPPQLPDWVFTYNNAINADAVRIRGRTAPAGTLKLKGIRFSDIERENDIAHIILSFQLHFRRNGWRRKHLNAGFYEKVTYTDRTQGGKRVTELRRIKINDEYPTDPVPLDRAGRRPRYFSGEIITELKPEDLVILTFELDDEKPFSVLPLR